MKKYTIIILTLFTSLLSAQFMQNEKPAELQPDETEFLSDVIIVQGLYIRSLGNFGKVWANATGGYINYGMFFQGHDMLSFQIGYLNYNLKDGLEYDRAELTVIPLLIGGRYFFINARFMPYFSYMNGINIINQTVGFNVDEDENIHIDDISGDETLVRYAWQLGVGLMINLISNLNLDLTAKYNSHFYQTEAMNTGFEYGFGLAWSLNN